MKITPQVTNKTKEIVKELQATAQKAEQLDTFDQYTVQLKIAMQELKTIDKANTPLLLEKFSVVLANYYLLSQKKDQLENQASELFDLSVKDYHSEEGKKINEAYNQKQKESDKATDLWNDLGQQICSDFEVYDGALYKSNQNVEDALKYDAQQEAQRKEQEEKERHVDFEKENLEAFYEINTKYYDEKDRYDSYADYAKQHMDASQKSGNTALNKKECLGFYPKLKHDYDKKNWFLKIFAFKERGMLKTIKNNLAEYKVDVSKLDSYKGYVDKKFGLDKSDFGNGIWVPEVVNDAKKEPTAENLVKETNKDGKEFASREELLNSINQDLNKENKSLDNKKFDAAQPQKTVQMQNTGVSNG